MFQAVRELQNSARDTIFLLKALLSEIQKSSEDEKKAVTDLYDLMMEKITEMKTELLNEVDRYIYQCLMTQMTTLQVHILQEAKLVLSVTYMYIHCMYLELRNVKLTIHVDSW